MRMIFDVHCVECSSNNIWYDEEKGELFCQECGLILEERYSLQCNSRLSGRKSWREDDDED